MGPLRAMKASMEETRCCLLNLIFMDDIAKGFMTRYVSSNRNTPNMAA